MIVTYIVLEPHYDGTELVYNEAFLARISLLSDPEIQVLNQEDPSWWQAKVLESSHTLPSEAQTGLIPSQTLQV